MWILQHIAGSSFFVEVRTSDTEASSSTAKGIGLSGGIAGERLSFNIQTRDSRLREVQTVVVWAEVSGMLDMHGSSVLQEASRRARRSLSTMLRMEKLRERLEPRRSRLR